MIIGLFVGIITGYLLSMPPIGPTNILVISKGFEKQIKYGVAVGAGAGFMDMIYILISYGGYALIKGFVPESIDYFFSENEYTFKILLTIGGCVVVILTGLNLIKKKQSTENQFSENKLDEKLSETERKISQKQKRIEKFVKREIPAKNEESFASGFIKGAILCVSSITIPASWFAITGYMKNYGIIDSRFLTGLLYSLGVLAGTTFWFWTLVKVISINAHKINPKTLAKINVVVGFILIGLGLFLIYKVIDYIIH